MLGLRAESQRPAAIVVCTHRGTNLTGRIQNETVAHATIPSGRATGVGVTLSPLQACRVPDGLLLFDKSTGQRAALLLQSSWMEQTSFCQAKKYPNMQVPACRGTAPARFLTQQHTAVASAGAFFAPRGACAAQNMPFLNTHCPSPLR